MNIKIHLTDDIPTNLTGGEYGVLNLEIFIDKKLPIRDQRINVIHSIIENFFQGVEHNKLDFLTNLIQDGLDQLEVN